MTGSTLDIFDGGLYAGDGGRILNTTVYGNPPPPVDVVPPCNGCEVSGTIPNYNATPLPMPVLYEVSDFEPGGQYAQESGWFPGCVAPDGCGDYHYYTSTVPFSGTLLTGLYYVESTVILTNVSGNGSIVATGRIEINGSAVLTTFDQRFPLLFSTSPNTLTGAIRLNNLILDLHGNIYAPDERVDFVGTGGTTYGLVYAHEVRLAGSHITIICPICNIAALSLGKSVTPTINVPYHGVVTYTVVLKNTSMVSDTSALFTDTLPAGVAFGQWLEQPASGVIQNGNAITWTGVVTASAGITFTFTATHTGDYGDVVTNTAYFSGTSQTGSDDATFSVTSIYYTLIIATAGNGSGVVTPTVGAHPYPFGAVVTLQATANPGSTFAGWSGAAGCAAGQVTIDADKTCTAMFTLNTFIITPTASLGGSITPNTPQTVNYGDNATFVVTANTGYHIVDVGVDGVSQGAIGFYAFTNVTANHTITAAFAIDQHDLAIAKTGSGSGVVTPTVGTHQYSYGTVVTLEAIANAGSTFTGWSGDAGCAAGQVTMDANKTCTATFVTYRIYLPAVSK